MIKIESGIIKSYLDECNQESSDLIQVWRDNGELVVKFWGQEIGRIARMDDYAQAIAVIYWIDGWLSRPIPIAMA